MNQVTYHAVTDGQVKTELTECWQTPDQADQETHKVSRYPKGENMGEKQCLWMVL